MRLILLSFTMITSTLITLLLIEASLRLTDRPVPFSSKIITDPVFKGWKDSPFIRSSMTRIYKFIPYQDPNELKSIDAYGFRFNSNHKKNNYQISTLKLLAIGDSFTYGHGVKPQETYPAILENFMQKSIHNAYIDNAGIPGYGLDQEYIYINEILRIRKYDIILWTIYVNDIIDSNDACLLSKTRNGFIQIPAWFNYLYLKFRFERPIESSLYDSHIIQYLISALAKISGKERFTPSCSKNKAKYEVLQKDFEEKIAFSHSQIIKEYPNIKIIYILAPFRHFFIPAIPNDETTYARRVIDRIEKFLTSNNYVFLNSSKLIQSLYDSKIINREPDSISTNIHKNPADDLFLDEFKYFGNNSHLNKLGNEYFAYSIYDFLQRNTYFSYIKNNQ